MKAVKIGTIIWSIVISVGLIVLVGSMLLPSTKRARFDFQEVQREREEQRASEEAEAARVAAASQPATVPTTQTGKNP